jgi:hypothetical protein
VGATPILSACLVQKNKGIMHTGLQRMPCYIIIKLAQTVLVHRCSFTAPPCCPAPCCTALLQWLKVTTRKIHTPLEPQSQSGAMLPPGCSISDPHYSIRDPVYFVDTTSKSN